MKRIDADEVLTILSWDHQRLLTRKSGFAISRLCEDKFTKMKESMKRRMYASLKSIAIQQQVDTVRKALKHDDS